MNNSHYCFTGDVHESECDCNCESCTKFMFDLKRKAFNERLSKRIKETTTSLFDILKTFR
jgi:hypothetical protein